MHWALQICSVRNQNAQFWLVLSFYTWCASLTEGFLLNLALEDVAFWEHHWMVSFIILIHRREVSALRDYQWEFVIRVKKSWSSQNLQWPMSHKNVSIALQSTTQDIRNGCHSDHQTTLCCTSIRIVYSSIFHCILNIFFALFSLYYSFSYFYRLHLLLTNDTVMQYLKWLYTLTSSIHKLT